MIVTVAIPEESRTSRNEASRTSSRTSRNKNVAQQRRPSGLRGLRKINAETTVRQRLIRPVSQKAGYGKHSGSDSFQWASLQSAVSTANKTSKLSPREAKTNWQISQLDRWFPVQA